MSGQIKDRIPDLPIVVAGGGDRARFAVGDGKTPTDVDSRWSTKADRERWNDWGIGLLLQGDLKGAEYAFTTVTEAEPEYADGWLNVARALIQEGRDRRREALHRRRRSTLDPSLGRIYFFKALVEKADGDYAGGARLAATRRRSSIRATASCSTRSRASCS